MGGTGPRSCFTDRALRNGTPYGVMMHLEWISESSFSGVPWGGVETAAHFPPFYETRKKIAQMSMRQGGRVEIKDRRVL